MRMVRVGIRNFRCYRDELSIDIGDITALIGKNDAGKSTIIDALDIFYENSKLDADDANKDCDKKDARIICEFSDLPPTIVLDASNTTTLVDEHLLNESACLEIHKVYDGSLKTPKLKGTFAKAVHPASAEVGDLLTLKRRPKRTCSGTQHRYFADRQSRKRTAATRDLELDRRPEART